ncbi:MAG: serine hydrolase domain-containing protein [Bacteroidales bacterium]|nr:beta-lactamase family protein [Bacteroidales bacterium]MDD2264879.1 serine hydrolase [Bacteroidales bacterium]MDD2831955.1 serine hydrolase [Bacteroidales bacterium]MDD4473566.1 serine hydrolase [Bacteroidales bacterium]MDD5047101.1 serine hydrolase [Bacteroidales bacterium]
MKTNYFCLSLIFVIITTGCYKFDAASTSYHTKYQALKGMLESVYEDYTDQYPEYPGGLVLKVIGGGEEYFLMAGVESTVTAQTHFRAASCTKTFTATAILLLHQQGKLRITDLITDTIPGTNQTYLPDGPGFDIPYKDRITILDLLRHRAGVFDVANDSIPPTVSADVPYKELNYIYYILDKEPEHTFHFDELIHVVAETGLSYFAPDSDYHYSNTGYSILGKIIERVTGMSYKDFLEKHVLQPMGMYHSYMPVSGADQVIADPGINGFLLIENESYEITTSNMSAFVAEGNMVTTPNDLSRFLRKLLSGKGILSYYTVNSLMMNCISTGTQKAGGYGCGLLYTNNLGYGHSGAQKGYLTFMACDPVADFTVVVYTNAWNLNEGMASLEYQITDLLQGICYRSKSFSITSSESERQNK